jgi:hypothetical protein
MAQPPWGEQQPPEYPPSGRPRRHKQSPSHGQQAYEQQAYEQQQPHGQPSYEQPPYGQQSYEQPPYGQQSYEQQAYGQQSYEQQQPHGQPSYGQPSYEQPPYGQQSYGQQAYGQQAYEQQPSYGQPSYEQQSYGQPQQYSPYDQPRQSPPYDQPPYGNGGQHPSYGGAGGQYGGGPGGQYGSPGGQYGGGSGGQYPPNGSKKRGNGFAVAGIILAVLLAPLGLILAIVGLVKSGARDGAGKVLSIVAIVVSLIVGGAITAGIVAIRNSTVVDPGCIAAESSARGMDSTMNADNNAISKDENNPAAEKTDLKKFGDHLQTFIAQLNAAEAEAEHQSVKDKIGQLSGDLSGMLTALQAIEKGDTSQVSKVDSYANLLNSDGTAIDQLCVPFGGDDSSGS